MKNLIFLCVFFNEGYIKLLELLLESIYLYGNLLDNTEILIYTSTEFSDIIKKNTLLADKIIFHINDNYNSLEEACKSRYDFFIIPGIEKYQTVLYLDTDIIIKKDLNQIFDNVIEREKIYVFEEGDISSHCDYWGHTLFTGEEIDKFEDKTAFTSGVILFRNCEVINTLFEKTKKDMIDREQHFSTIDQPFLIYNAMKYKLYDNKKLKDHVLDFRSVKNINTINDSNKSLLHYISEVGKYQDKHTNMSKTIDILKKHKNLIYMCVFHNEEYLQLLIMLLNSILLYGNINFSTHLLIYTTTNFQQKIRQCLQNSLYFPMNNANYLTFISKIYFQINDNYTTLNDACKSRLDIFEFPITKSYSKILYMDVDCVVQKSIAAMFDILKKDIVYAVQEGSIDNDMWGKTLFGCEIDQYEDKTAFSSGIMLFKNTEKIKKLFEITKYDMITRKGLDTFYDQPYIVYNLKKFRSVDNKQLLTYINNNNDNSFDNKIIIHFYGDVGVFLHKYNNMKKLMNELTTTTRSE